MPIRFSCAQCDARVKTPDGTVGKKMKCPRCGHLQRVPGPPEVPPEVPPEAPPETSPETSPAAPPESPESLADEPTQPAQDAPPAFVGPAAKPGSKPREVRTTPASEDDALAALAAAAGSGVDDEEEGDSSETAGLFDTIQPGESADEESQNEQAVVAEPAPPQEPAPGPAAAQYRQRPTPKPKSGDATSQAADAPKAIPLSAHRPRPTPRPDGVTPSSATASAHDSMLSAQTLSGSGAAEIASEVRARSMDATGDLPHARSRRQIERAGAMLNVIAWLSRLLAVLIAAGAVELMLHVGRNGGSWLTRIILLGSGLAVAAIAVAVGQLAATLRKS